MTMSTCRHCYCLLFYLSLYFPITSALFFGSTSVAHYHKIHRNAPKHQLLRDITRLSGGASDSHPPSNVNLKPRLRFQAEPTTTQDNEPPPQVLVIMDGFCPYHSGYLAARALDRPGVVVCDTLSNYLHGYLLQTEPDDALDWEQARMPNNPEETKTWIQGLPSRANIVAVYCESDSGLQDAEQLRLLLQTTSQDQPCSLEARRNKFLMNERLKEEGVAVAKQKLCQTLEEAQEFVAELLQQAKGAIVKPIRGVASESVFLCQNMQDIQRAWETITSSAVFGQANQRHTNVLVQEYLEGTEYAVDVVSRHGEHKAIAIWKYDKRPVNGAPFVYYKTELVDESIDDHVRPVCEHVFRALDALGVRQGISHNEVIIKKEDGSVAFVEANCRQHNMDFLPLTMAAIGVNVFDAYLDAIFSEENWNMYPTIPKLRAYAAMIHLVNSASGRLRKVRHLEDIASLSSTFEMEVYDNFVAPGEIIEPTVNIRTDAGWVQMMNDNKEQLDHDYDSVVQWMPTMFDVE